jgi:plastocyanin
MFRKGILLVVAAIALVACGEEVIPEANDEPGVTADEDADPDADADEDVPDTPVENLDDCAEVSAAEGAPAGLTMMDSFFEPPCLAVSSTQAIALQNSGNIEHNFSVSGGDIDIDVEPGDEASTDEVGTDLAAGTYQFFCKYHEGDGMVGTLVVE